jgi:hypothetical protein
VTMGMKRMVMEKSMPKTLDPGTDMNLTEHFLTFRAKRRHLVSIREEAFTLTNRFYGKPFGN